MKREKVIVSACLLGENCRYDGCSKKDSGVIAFLKDKEVIPFCPEAPVLGTPRGRVSVVATEEHGLRVKKDADSEDVTDLLIEQVEKIIKAHPDATMIILKSKSPSCGIATTPILDEAGNEIGLGNGIAADMLMHAFPDIEIVDENAF